MRSTTLVATLLLMLAACGEAADGSATTTSPPAAVTTRSPSTTVLSTTQASPPTTTTPHIPPPQELVMLEPGNEMPPPLAWERAGIEAERNREHWLGATGDALVLLTWSWAKGAITVRTSSDGVTWSPEASVTGLPEGFSPGGRDDPLGAAAGEAGIIMGGRVGPLYDERAELLVATSPDGLAWTTHSVDQFGGDIAAVAAGAEGFAVMGGILDRGTPSAQYDPTLWWSPDGATWQPIAVPNGSDIVTALAEAFVVAPHDELWRVTPDQVAGMASPLASYAPLLFAQWNDDLLLWAAGPFAPIVASGIRSALVLRRNGTWVELPFPASARSHREPIEDDAWDVEAMDAGELGIVAAAYHGAEFWGFYGEAFWPINLTKGGYEISVFGDNIGVDPDVQGTRPEFDVENGTLIVVGADGETVVEVTCAELRAAALAGDHVPPGLLGTPEQRMAFSPDGLAWREQPVADLFGAEAYVFSVVALDDRAVVLLQPNGDRPIPDPPGCKLGVYPEERPFEIWVGTLERP